jgi:hypothetical protein
MSLLAPKMPILALFRAFFGTFWRPGPPGGGQGGPPGGGGGPGVRGVAWVDSPFQGSRRERPGGGAKNWGQFFIKKFLRNFL